jgi:hypothetical protein
MNAFTNTASIAENLYKDLTMQIEENIKRDGALSPCFVIFTREGRLLSIEPNIIDDDTKPLVYAAVRCACIAHGALIMAFLHEAWCLPHDPGLPFPTVRPSQSERRIEAAFVSCCWCEDDNRRFLISGREIIRNSSGGIEGLGRELADDKNFAAGGIVSELLPTSSFDRATRRRAQRDLDQMCRHGIIEVEEFDSMTSN